MSGGNVPYHLRPNKHIDRTLFVELLGKICGQTPPSSYAYVSMGGPQLEDHRLIHNVLSIKKLLSFEIDKSVYERQIFNLRPSCLKCFDKPIDDFVNDFQVYATSEEIDDKKIVVWLDYATTDRRKQLIQYEKLISKLQEQDVVKITLNANIDSFGVKQDVESQEEIQLRRFEKIKKQISDYLPANLSHTQMNANDITAVLSGAIEAAALKGLSRKPRTKPALLSLFAYQDANHMMLTATIRLTGSSDLDNYRYSLQWEYLPKDWKDIKYINVPFLTPKERLEIDGKLPAENLLILYNSLPFKLDPDEEKSKLLLEEYARHYKRYPSYLQATL